MICFCYYFYIFISQANQIARAYFTGYFGIKFTLKCHLYQGSMHFVANMLWPYSVIFMLISIETVSGLTFKVYILSQGRDGIYVTKVKHMYQMSC